MVADLLISIIHAGSSAQNGTMTDGQRAILMAQWANSVQTIGDMNLLQNVIDQSK